MQPASETDPLPTPRTFLTSLINAISAIPLTPASDPQLHPPQPASSPSPPSSTPPPIPSTLPPKPKPNPNQQRPLNSEKEQSSSNNNNNNNNNPLHRVPPASRPLITTLHVLFPGLVLPALGLLERGFVARVSVDVEEGASGLRSGVGVGRTKDGGEAGERDGRDGKGNEDEDGGDGDGDGNGDDVRSAEAEVPTPATTKPKVKPNPTRESNAITPPSFYLVQSAAAAEAARERWRRRRYGGGGGGAGGGGADEGDGEETNGAMGTTEAKVYIVRLEAWHCTCAAFAFSSVQDGGEWDEEEQDEQGKGKGFGEVDEPKPAGAERSQGKWSFGGLSLDGLEPGLGNGVSVCKHLLACVLADRWREALGKYVVERKMRREEVAGIVADV
ncbi:uncharacterized protein C8A04DRAFT_31563 [Dichotomopilus funicola]|uniref:SWIM-type domain-containing protein n=1 Tax=Dichotomopilus funicola TaxID=1934379 RepID=A0AAN6ZKN9_9PEZI|nr:hypothetical protein C8A04DRAFT_31563 [Dichotomopilus funicola]